MGLQGFLEGGVASIAAGCATHPLDLIKVRMQLHGETTTSPIHFRRPPALVLTIPIQRRPPPPSPLSVAARIIHLEGLPALFSGLSATILRQALYSTTRLGLYDALKSSIFFPGRQGTITSPEATSPPLHQKIAAGLIAGATGAAIGNPTDVALVRMQADGRLPPLSRRNYSGVVDALFQIFKKEGVASLWRGSALTIQRAMVVTASQLVTYDQAKDSLIRQHGMRDGVAAHLTASCTAGLAAAIASNPIDVIKTRIMNMKTEPGQIPTYSGALDCAIKTVKTEGPMAMYKGFVPTVMRQGPYTVVLFVTLEQVRNLFQCFT